LQVEVALAVLVGMGGMAAVVALADICQVLQL
jgi:hypothetical protein